MQILLLLCGDVEIRPGPVGDIFTKRGLKIFHQNVQGLLSNIDKVQVLLKKFPVIDILTLSETHINTNTHNDNAALYHIPGYTFLHRNREKGTWGGVGMYIKDQIRWKRRADLEHDNLEFWIEIIQKNAKNFLVGTLYRPPSSSKYLPKDFETYLDNMLLIVTSETKHDYLKPDDNKSIKDILLLYGLVQLVTTATRVTATSKTLIDLILTSRIDCVYENDVIPTSIGDHDMIGFIRKLRKEKIPPRTIRSRNYSNYDHATLKSDVRNYDWQPLYDMNNVNLMWLYMKNALLDIFEKHAPIVEKRVKGRFCPWLSTEIHQLMNDRDKSLKKARKSNAAYDWKAYRKLRNKCTYEIRTSKSNYSKNLLKENSTNPRKFWNVIKNIMPTKPKTHPDNNESVSFDKVN